METAASNAETALEGQRLGPLQFRVMILCTLVQICDGYDISAIGNAVPSLRQAWSLAPASFAQAFVWSSIGILVGALASGPIGDRLGRKPLLLASIALFGVASLASAGTDALWQLTLLRFFTGIGIGGAMPGTVALMGDYTPRRSRVTMIMITFTGAPLGGFLGGQIIALLLPHFGWRSIFVLGGLIPLLMLPALAIWMPESARFLLAKGRTSGRHTALFAQLGIDPIAASARTQRVDVATRNPVTMMFTDGYGFRTICLWVLFFANLLDMYLLGYWLPAVLNLLGMAPADAVFAASLRELGAMGSTLYLGPLIDRFGTWVLALHLACGIVFIAALALVSLPYPVMLLVILGTGLTTTGSQTGSNAVAGTVYPARMRTTGIGWALGIGRFGGIAGPAMGGVLLAAGWPPTQIFLSACFFALLAAVAAALLGRGPAAARPITATEVAS
ncbi:MAG TPA: MFS transporter [Stellaceae bacterium]|nr:MFS transporter [Stellaceae bacterium]